MLQMVRQIPPEKCCCTKSRQAYWVFTLLAWKKSLSSAPYTLQINPIYCWGLCLVTKRQNLKQVWAHIQTNALWVSSSLIASNIANNISLITSSSISLAPGLWWQLCLYYSGCTQLIWDSSEKSPSTHTSSSMELHSTEIKLNSTG